jgi:hypothetical protein
MPLEEDLIEYAIDQYKVSGEGYVVDCMAIWEREYGTKTTSRVRQMVEKQLKIRFKVRPIAKWL